MKFHFVPVSKHKKVDESSGLYLNIYNKGQVVIPKYSGIKMGFSLEAPTVISLFLDMQKRTIGFRIEKSIVLNGERPNNVRVVSATQTSVTTSFGFSIKKLLDQFKDVATPLRMEISEYKDDTYGKLFYFTIPVADKKLEVAEEEK